MKQYTRLIHHCQVQRSPILKEREIDELVVDSEIVVRRAVIRRDWSGPMVVPRADLGAWDVVAVE